MNPIESGLDQFNRAPFPGELNLIQSVRDLLISKGLKPEVETAYNTHSYIQSAEKLNCIAQRYYLNLYWNLQLMQSGKECTNERICLVNRGNPADWLTLFTGKVLPFIIENNLPRQL